MLGIDSQDLFTLDFYFLCFRGFIACQCVPIQLDLDDPGLFVNVFLVFVVVLGFAADQLVIVVLLVLYSMGGFLHGKRLQGMTERYRD